MQSTAPKKRGRPKGSRTRKPAITKAEGAELLPSLRGHDRDLARREDELTDELERVRNARAALRKKA